MKIFSKTLCATDINRRCVVGMNYFKMERFPKLQGHYKVDFVVKDESGRGTTAATGSSFDKEQLPTNHSIFQVIKCYKTERSLSLELTLKPTMTGGSTAATSSCIYTEQTPNPHSTSRDIKCDKITRPSLNLSLELALTPTMTGRPHHAYMQWTEPKTINFFGS
ncbi:hypothetical protein QQP08_018183 [Theobroma cacao]|nr:hypothetical protein QQP08_018183 [Theobroma cacao]